ncbi:MAG: hypothetical protein GX444_03185 [Myxococcales bacterium]|nr:hypothetical protein [Myxococcales bacterium]
MRFLWSRTEPDSLRDILLVQTCNPDLLAHVAAEARRRFPRARLTALLQKDMRPYLPADLPVDQTIDNPRGGKRGLLRRLRAGRFDAVCLIESGESGFWKLKLLPWILGSRAVLVYDRFGSAAWLEPRSVLAGFGGGLAGRPKILTRRRLAAPLIYWQCRRFYRQRMKNQQDRDS